MELIAKMWFALLDFLLADITLPEFLYKMLPAYYFISGILFIIFGREWSLLLFGFALFPAAVTVWAARKGVL